MRVGQPWNEVYAECCVVFKANTYLGQICRERILQEVEQNVFWHKNKLCYIPRWSYHKPCPMPIEDETTYHVFLYVHPDTGILEKIEPRKIDWGKIYKDKRRQTIVDLDDYHILHKIEGIWYDVQLAPLPKTELAWYYTYSVKNRKQESVQKICKRQLNSKQLKKHGLKND